MTSQFGGILTPRAASCPIMLASASRNRVSWPDLIERWCGRTTCHASSNTLTNSARRYGFALPIARILAWRRERKPRAQNVIYVLADLADSLSPGSLLNAEARRAKDWKLRSCGRDFDLPTRTLAVGLDRIAAVVGFSARHGVTCDTAVSRVTSHVHEGSGGERKVIEICERSGAAASLAQSRI